MMTSTQSRETNIPRNDNRFSKRNMFIEKLKHWWVQWNELKTEQEKDMMGDAEFKETFLKFQLSYDERVNSFITRGWPKYISVSKLAECGFCFTGDSDIVVCFSCKGKLKDWEDGDVPLKKHLKAYPRCKFARSKLPKRAPKVTFDSIPSVEIDEGAESCVEEEMEDYFKSEFNRLVSFRKCSLSSCVDPYELAAVGLYYLGDWSENGTTEEKEQISHHCCLSVDAKGNISLTDEERKQAEIFFPQVEKLERSMMAIDVNDTKGGSGAINVNQYDKYAVHPEYSDKNNRVRTFTSCRSTFPIPVQSLAEAGFYSTNSKDEVACFFCGGKLIDWEPNDNPWEEHARNFPDCQWVLEQIPDQSMLGSYIPSLKSPNTSFELVQSRITSFLENGWSLQILVSKLAEAGFFHSGDPDTTECFSCHVKIEDWTDTDDPLEKHKKKSPNCEFLRDLTKELLEYTQVVSGTEAKVDNDPELSDECEVDSDSRIKKLGSVLMSRDKKSANDKFKSEYQRLLSYYNWPLRSIVDPFDLANAGFYWRDFDPSVTVKCFACYGEITEWQIGEKPYKKHEQFYSSCPFINNLETGNKKLTEAEKSKVSSLFGKRAEARNHPNILVQKKTTRDKGVCRNDSNKSEVSHRNANFHLPQKFCNEICFNYASETLDGSQIPEEVTSLNGTGSSAKYPQFLAEETRLETFVKWPPNHCQRPEDLANAGFFFKGEKDHVACFHCGGKLIDWEIDDKPWNEHARHYPNCGWLLKQKGRVFINDILQKDDTSEHLYGSYHGSEKNQNPLKTMEASLFEEMEKVKKRSLCTSCLDDDVEILFLPCKHIAACKECAERIESCPNCRSYVEEKVCVFVP